MLKGEIFISSAGSNWRVELRGDVGRRVWDVPVLGDERLAEIPGLIPEARTWAGFVAHFPPRGWSIPLPALRQAGNLIRQHLFEREESWFAEMRHEATRRNLRLGFILDINDSTPQLATLPLELAFDGQSWLFKRRFEPAVRCNSYARSAPRARIQRGDRLLVVTASSRDNPVPSREELRAHAKAVQAAAQSAGMATEWLEEASPENLLRRLDGEPPVDLLYIVCHGVEDPDCSGRLVLHGPLGDQSLQGVELAKRIKDSSHGKPLKAVLLCACSSATPGTRGPEGTTGMAQWLLRDGKVFATLGYRQPVSVAWALGFSERLFSRLQEGTGLEEAFTEIRWQQRDDDPQWALPLLYTRQWEQSASVPSAAGSTRTAPSSPRPPLKSILPRPPRRYFVARQKELNQLRQWLRTPGRAAITAVTGEGGIGKTELATMIAYECHAQGRPVLWLDRPLSQLRNALLTLIRAREPSFTPAPEATEEDLAARAHLELGADDGLLILDDATGGSQHDLDALTPGGGWNVLVTTRISGLFSEVLDIPLQPLEPDDALRLLSEVAWGRATPLPEEAPAAYALIQELGGLPLALEIAGDTLRTQGLSTASYLADYRARTGTARADVDRVAAVLIRSLEVLGEQARHVLGALSVLPKAGSSFSLTAQTLGLREPEAARHLDHLVRHHLATFSPEDGVYAIHPLIREATRGRLKEEPNRWNQLHREAATALAQLADWIQSPVGASIERAMEHWRVSSESFGSLDLTGWQDGADGRELIAYVLVVIDQFRQLDWSLEERANALELAWNLGFTGNSVHRARFHFARGLLRMRQDNLQGASDDYSHALALSEQLDDRLGQANTLKARSDLLMRQNNLQGALDDYNHALTLYGQLGDRLGKANTLRARGDLHLRQGDLQKAAEDYGQALTIYKQLSNPLGQANTLQARGDLLTRQDNLQEASGDYSQALALYEQLGAHLGQANTRRARGELFMRQNNLQDASDDYNRALALYKQLGNRIGQANTLRARGYLHIQQDNLPDALNDYNQALALSEQVGDHLGQASTRRARGDLSLWQGDLQAASEDYTQALTLFEQLGEPLGQANTLQSRGDLLMQQKDLEKALQNYSMAYSIYVDINEALGRSNTLVEMARIFISQGQQEKAEAAIKECIPLALQSRNAYALNFLRSILEYPSSKKDE